MVVDVLERSRYCLVVGEGRVREVSTGYPCVTEKEVRRWIDYGCVGEI